MIPGFEKVRNGRPSLLAHLHDRLTVLPLGRVLTIEAPPGKLQTERLLLRAIYRLLRAREDGDEFEVGRFAGQLSVRRKKKPRRKKAQKGDGRGSGSGKHFQAEGEAAVPDAGDQGGAA